MAGPDGRSENVSDLAEYRQAGRGGALERLRKSNTQAFELLELVAIERGISPAELLVRHRGPASVAAARQLAMYLIHTTLGENMGKVGAFFGRDRTTVAYACRVIEDRRDEGDAAFDEELARLEQAANELTTHRSEVMHARR